MSKSMFLWARKPIRGVKKMEIGACNTIITDKYLQYTNDTGQNQIRSVVLSSTHRNVHPEKLVVLINNL